MSLINIKFNYITGRTENENIITLLIETVRLVGALRRRFD
jgi:hypothetical protein